MKRLLIYLFILAVVLSAAGCGKVKNEANETAATDSIKTYKDVPEVTEKEITEIEKLKTERDNFIYGALLSTEAYILPDGTYAGYTVEFCKFLSELFDVSFKLEIGL